MDSATRLPTRRRLHFSGRWRLHGLRAAAACASALLAWLGLPGALPARQAAAPGAMPTSWICGAVAFTADGPYYVNATDVNLRDAPNGGVLLVFNQDDKVYVIKREGKWAYVSAVTQEKKGWVYGKYLSMERADASADGAEQAAPGGGGGQSGPAAQAAHGSAPAVVVDGVCVKDSGNITAAGEGDSGTGAAGGKAAASLSPGAARRNTTVTTPADLGGGYKPLGGAGIALIGATDVNVRADASLKSKIVGQVDKGDKLYIVTVDDPWYCVSIPAKGLKGWVFGEYVNELPRVEIKGSQVRLRESPSLSGRVKTELDKGEVFFKFAQKNGWVLVASSASGLKGWVKAEWVKKTGKSASRPYRVTGDQINFRASPNVDADVLAELPQGAEVQVLGRNEKWSYVQRAGQQGWIYSAYLDPNFRNAPKEVYGKSIGDRLIKRAMALQGTPYVWGGESEGGVDCSGLVYKVLCDEGADAANLPRRASTQMAGLGQEVDKEDLQPGDLVFFHTYKDGASHVGIYLGDGNFVHASSAKHQVAIGNMSDGYYKQRFVGARRITEDELKRLK